MVNLIIFATKQWKRRLPPISLLLSLLRSPTQMVTGTDQPVHCQANISPGHPSQCNPRLSHAPEVSLSVVLVTGMPSSSPQGRGRIIFHLYLIVSLRTRNPPTLTLSSRQSSALQTGGRETVTCGWVSSADSL